MRSVGESHHEPFYLALDVGSRSLRAGLFDSHGKMIGRATRDISVFDSAADYHEQSSEEIWQKALDACNEALKLGDRREVKAVSFDATCSLAVLGKDGKPLSISPMGDPDRNVIMWMDHRAIREAEFITSSRGEPVHYLGDVVSPEHELPKLLWLKRNMKEAYANIGEVFDLADYLGFMATGSKARSTCTLTCKWGYLAHKPDSGWDKGFFNGIELGDLYENHLSCYEVKPIGSKLARVSQSFAESLGLDPGCLVATPLIDAHSGGIGSAGAAFDPDSRDTREETLTKTLVITMGTSNCHMAASREPTFISGVWGPYYGAMIPGLWLNEAGQNATGALLDHILEENRLYGELTGPGKDSIFDTLNRVVDELRRDDFEFNRNLNVLPYFYGNRSPRADPDLWGTIDGLRLEDDITAYAKLYLSTIQALAFGSRHIIEEMEKNGYEIKYVVATGGHIKNRLLLQEHANILERPIYLTEEKEDMLSGGAINAATAAGDYPDIIGAMAAMSRKGDEILPQTDKYDFYKKKYRVFKRMYDYQVEIKEILD